MFHPQLYAGEGDSTGTAQRAKKNNIVRVGKFCLLAHGADGNEYAFGRQRGQPTPLYIFLAGAPIAPESTLFRKKFVAESIVGVSLGLLWRVKCSPVILIQGDAIFHPEG